MKRRRNHETENVKSKNLFTAWERCKHNIGDTEQIEIHCLSEQMRGVDFETVYVGVLPKTDAK